ncbi:hypothetical protein QWZ13_06680 [Reinekea marina]|uniref:hypothetical protein n=1 Tax=Reinekea marina TaxID=1310421 RepID=UPI0025B49D3A|nr:hypothetical protein [Reinekea marina]MDN3648595.1 hypothetical protein [Reinekea marina]
MKQRHFESFATLLAQTIYAALSTNSRSLCVKKSPAIAGLFYWKPFRQLALTYQDFKCIG